jgi:DNA-binding PadR family transcriptional regulator
VRILTSEAAVLLALGDGPASGVRLMDRLQGVPGATAPGPGTLYPLLRRLGEEGLVRSWVETVRVGVGRPRRFHELTASGRSRLDGLRRDMALMVAGPAAAQPRAGSHRMGANLRRAFRVSALARRLRDAGTGR